MTALRTEPQVADYMLRLQVATARMPREEADELRDQILEHLSEAIGDGTSTAEIAAVLKRLGRPEDLAAEAMTTRPRGARLWLRARPWWTWAVVVVVLAAIGSGVGYVVNMADQPTLQGSCAPCGWYYPADSKAAHDIDIIAGDEEITAIRPGQLQGFDVTISNPSSSPETIVGLQPRMASSLGSPRPPTIAISTVDPNRGGDISRTAWSALPVTIPPRQYRYLRVTWRSASCYLEKAVTVGTSDLYLRVKVGWFTHNQTLALQETWALAGRAYSAPCDGGG